MLIYVYKINDTCTNVQNFIYFSKSLVFAYSYAINSAMKDCFGTQYITFIAVSIHSVYLIYHW